MFGMSRKRKIIILSTAISLLGAGAAAYALHLRSTRAQPAPPDRTALFRKAREVAQRPDASEEERRRAFEAARLAMQTRLDHEMDEYFNARSDDDKAKVLDRGIDEMQKRRKEMEERRQ